MVNNFPEIPNDVSITVILQKDNNLDGEDNLAKIPETPCVYFISGCVNEVPANVRFVGLTDNLRFSVSQHFDPENQVSDELRCFKEFMLSIKTKFLGYKPVKDLDSGQQELEDWKKNLDPKCTEELNTIY